MQCGQNVGAHLAGVFYGNGSTANVPACRGGARWSGPTVRGVRGKVAVPSGPADLHRRPGRGPVRVAVHHHILDTPQDIILSHRAPQTPSNPFQRDKLQTR